ncbi:RING-type E3 ubiquitin transferase [Sarracenia purpurea var. burkii]
MPRRTKLIEKSLELLPEVQQHEAKIGKLLEIAPSVNEAEIPARSDLSLMGLLVPPSIDSSLILLMDKPTTSTTLSVLETPSKLWEPWLLPLPCKGVSLLIQKEPQSIIVVLARSSNLKISRTSGVRQVSQTIVTPLNELNRSSSRVPQNSSARGREFDEVSPEKERNRFTQRLQNTGPYTLRADQVASLGSNNAFVNESARDPFLTESGKRVPSDVPHRPWKVVPSDDLMDSSWSHGGKGSVEDGNVVNGGPRWRSDDSSEDEEMQSPGKPTGPVSYTTPMRGLRRSRLTRRR